MDTDYRILTGAVFAKWTVYYRWYWADRAYEQDSDNAYGLELRLTTMLEF